jgi:hypothetical protein
MTFVPAASAVVFDTCFEGRCIFIEGHARSSAQEVALELGN